MPIVLATDKCHNCWLLIPILSTEKKEMYGNLVNMKIVASDIFSGKAIDPINGI